ncbi:hypothetical protein [Amycolatopsis sp. 195334CR]|uniref:hypothetical protein n=1 Tax=Amycolatopsis sp. 195334CR TaxID=2814588 RepID=UPI001A8C92D6|nr:hypothetical protein [Amycolatopsis sp. 195334CR]MBN6037454.1 hypothetical protein [Amycolatopsis sp. 195334CR]
MADFDEIQSEDLTALHWAHRLPPIRDRRGARDRAAHELLHVLATFANLDDGRGAFPSIQSMAEAIGSDRVFVRRKLSLLEELGLIRRMETEEIAELLEERKVARGKAVVTDWAGMAGGTRAYYEARFNSEEGGQTAWALAVDDEALWESLEKIERERQQIARDKTLTRHRRHNSKRYNTPFPEEDCDGPNTVAKGRSVATVRSPSHDGANGAVRRSDHRRATVDSASHDGQKGVVRRRADPLPPLDPQVTAKVTAQDRPGTTPSPAAPDDGRLCSATGEVARVHADGRPLCCLADQLGWLTERSTLAQVDQLIPDEVAALMPAPKPLAYRPHFNRGAAHLPADDESETVA